MKRKKLKTKIRKTTKKLTKEEDREYPMETIEILDNLFPKGDKRRGDAILILAMAYSEGLSDK